MFVLWDRADASTHTKKKKTDLRDEYGLKIKSRNPRIVIKLLLHFIDSLLGSWSQKVYQQLSLSDLSSYRNTTIYSIKMIRFLYVSLCLALSMGVATAFVQPSPKTTVSSLSKTQLDMSYLARSGGGWNDYPTGSSFFQENNMNDSYTWRRSGTERKDDVYVNPYGPRYPSYGDYNRRDDYRAYYPNTSYSTRMYEGTNPNYRGLGSYTRGYLNNWYGNNDYYGGYPSYDVSFG